MSGAPISQEIRLPTNSDEVGKAVKKLDDMIARVEKLEKAGHAHRKETKETEGAFHSMLGTLGKVVRGTIMLKEGFHGAGLAAKEAHAGLGEFLEFTGAMALLEVLNKITEKVFDVGEEAIKSAAKAQRMSRVFALQQGGERAGKGAQEWIEKFSKGSEFTEAENESAFVNLRRHGVSSQQSGLIMKAAADIAAGAEDRSGAYQEAIAAFTRMQATGRVSARTLQPLGIGVEDFAKLPQFKGMSNQKINEALEKKNVNQNELFQLIMAHAGETKIGSRAADNVDLLSTKMLKLQELPERFFKKLGDTRAASQLAAALDGILTKLDPESPAGKRIFGGLESAFGSVADAVNGVDWESVSDGIASLSAKIGPAISLIKELGHDLGVAADAYKVLFPGNGVSNWIGEKIASRMAKREGLETAPVVAERMRGFDYASAKAKLHAAGGATPAMEGPIYEAPELNSLSAGAYGTGAAVAAGLAKGMEDSAPAVKRAAKHLGASTIDSLNESVDAHSPSRKAKRTGGFVAEGFAQGIEGGAGRISDAMDSTIRLPFDAGGASSTASGGSFAGTSISVVIQDGAIRVDGAARPEEVGHAVTEALARGIGPALADQLEQLRLQRGS
ncbi:MAG TPA: hypothetical protein VHG72_21950 [Polyangia bacterium]|nr:hypothetical protein [Polyangia bacterium]